MSTLICPRCGKELYDNGERVFRCPFCNEEIVSRDADGEAREESPEEKCQRLEREVERLKLKSDIETLSSYDNFWNNHSMISAYYRHKARTDLEFGDVNGARKNLHKATNAYNAGCLLNIIGAGIVIILMLLFAK